MFQQHVELTEFICQKINAEPVNIIIAAHTYITYCEENITWTVQQVWFLTLIATILKPIQSILTAPEFNMKFGLKILKVLAISLI